MIKLILCVMGETAKARKMSADFEQVLQEKYGDAYSIEIVDLFAEPEKADFYGVIATPTLIKAAPEPHQRVIGDLGDNAKVLEMLGLPNIA